MYTLLFGSEDMKLRKILAIFISIFLIFGALPIGILTTSALKFCDYTYTISEGEVTIVDCDESIVGNVTIPTQLDGYPVRFIADGAFAYCGLLSSITIPNCVIDVGEFAFKYCTKLETVKLPEDITSIEHGLFMNCNSLKTITIPQNVTSIGQEAFKYCDSLTSIIIPNRVVSIGEWSFYDCSSLKTIIINKSVTSIGDFAFESCNALDKVYFCGTEKQWNDISIVSFNNNDIYIANKYYHDFSDWHIRTEPTCTADGEKYRICTICGEEEIESVSDKGHIIETRRYCGYSYEGDFPCVEPDWDDPFYEPFDPYYEYHTTFDESYCTICGEIFSCEDIGYDCYTSSFEPTCTEMGCTYEYCSYCDELIREYYTLEKGHNFSDWIVRVEPTYNTHGEEYRYCHTCSYEETQIIPTLLPPHICEYVETVVTPTCTTGGYTYFECSCGNNYIGSETLPLGHKLEIRYYCELDYSELPSPDWIGDDGPFEPSYEAQHATYKYYFCTLCEEVCDSECLGACYDNKTVIEPTCTEEGIKKEYCIYCDETIEEYSIDALGHSYGIWSIRTKPTCITDGVKYCICTECLTEKTEVLPAIGHNYTATVTNASCTESGYTTHTCIYCSDSYITDETAALGHNYENRICTNCGDKYVTPASSFKYTISEEEVTITEFIGTETDVVIPETIEGYPVTKIGTTVFYRIPVTNIYFPKSVIFIDSEAIRNCVFLEEIEVDSDNTMYTSIDGILFDKNLNTILRYPAGKKETSYIISDGIQNIGVWAFEDCSYLETVIIPNTVVGIEWGAFDYCDSLISIYIPASVSYIDWGAFLECANLEIIEVDKENAVYTSIDGILYSKDLNTLVRFPAGKKVTSFTIPNGVECIYDYSFFLCSSIENLVLPDGVNSINHSAFMWCSSLKNITLTDSVTTIGDYVFWGCDTLTNVFYCGTQEQWEAIVIGDNNTEFTSANVYYHDYSDWTVRTEPTCTVNGETYRICSICGKEETKLIYATGHSYTATVTEPTCTEQGYTTYTCTVCEDSYIFDKTKPLGHSYGDWIIRTEPTCTTDGEKYKVCSACGEEETKVISATGHSYMGKNLLTDGGLEDSTYSSGVAFRTDTSTSNAHSGFQSVYGRGNGSERSFNTVLVSNEKTVEGKTYNLGGWVRGNVAIANAAYLQCTAGATNIQSYTFSVTTEWQYISMQITVFPPDTDLIVGIGITANVASGNKVWFDDLELNEVINWTVRTEPTCITNGEKYRTCSACGEEETKIISALGHDFSEDFVVDIEATFFEEGIKSRHCSRCSEVTDVTVIPKKSINGDCGADATWILTGDGVLTISGTGPMQNYPLPQAATWYTYRDKVKEIIIEKTITKIGNNSFNSFYNLESVYIYNPDTEFGYYVFAERSGITINSLGNSAVQEYALANSISFKKLINPETPLMPVLELRSANSVTLRAIDGYEYSIDSINWQSSNVFSGLQEGVEYSFYQRIAEGAYLATDSSPAIYVTTLTAPSAPEILKLYGNSAELVNEVGYEYSIDGVNWQSSAVINNLPYNTVVNVYRRKLSIGTDAETPASAPAKCMIVSAPKVMVGFASIHAQYINGFEYSLGYDIWDYYNVFTQYIVPGETYTVYMRPIDTEGITVLYNETGTTVVVNGDEQPETFNATHLTKLTKLLFKEEKSNNIGYDFNKDFEIDILDLVRLKKNLLGVQQIGLKLKTDYYHVSQIEGYEFLSVYQFDSTSLRCNACYTENIDWRDGEETLFYNGKIYYQAGYGGPLPDYTFEGDMIVLKFSDDVANDSAYYQGEARLVVTESQDLLVTYCSFGMFDVGDILDLRD